MTGSFSRKLAEALIGNRMVEIKTSINNNSINNNKEEEHEKAISAMHGHACPLCANDG